MSPNKTCEGCLHLHDIVDARSKVSQTVCVRYPPTVGIIIAQGVAGPQPVGISMYPSVSKISPQCGEFYTEKKSL